MKSIINVKCPECGGFLEIDVARQRVVSHRMKAGGASPDEKAKAFDDVLRRVADREGKAEDAFEAARDAVAQSEERLDELFGEFKKKVDEEKGKEYRPEDDPRNLFWD